MSFNSPRTEFETWDVRLKWTVEYPSEFFGTNDTSQNQFDVWGVDRGSITIARNLTKISSLEQYNQGFVNGIPDITITILQKESGPAFEIMRRISTSDIPFDLRLSLVSDKADNTITQPWMDGYEEYLGCRVLNERTNYNIAEFPVREFECMAMRRRVNGATGISLGDQSVSIDDLVEGDGTYNTVSFDLT